MSFLLEFWSFPARAEEVLAAADHARSAGLRRADRADPGLRDRAVHLHSVLMRDRHDAHLSESPHSIMTARRL